MRVRACARVYSRMHTHVYTRTHTQTHGTHHDTQTRQAVKLYILKNYNIEFKIIYCFNFITLNIILQF